jgi:hypothetical protein
MCLPNYPPLEKSGAIRNAPIDVVKTITINMFRASLNLLSNFVIELVTIASFPSIFPPKPFRSKPDPNEDDLEYCGN